MRGTTAAIVAALLLALPAPTALAGSWSAPAPGPAPDGMNMAIAPDGTAFGLWTEEAVTDACDDDYDAPIPGCVLRVARQTADGWGAAQTISTGEVGEVAGEMVVDAAGNATVLWTQFEGPGSAGIWTRRWSAGAWGPAQRVASAPVVYYGALAVGADGTVVAAWVDDAARTAHAAVHAGGAWSAPAVIATGGQAADFIETLVAEPGGSFTILMRRTNASRIGASRLHGGTWTDEGLITPSGRAAYGGEAVVAADGTVTAMWASYVAGRYAAESAQRVAGAWQAPEPVSASPASAGDVRLLVGVDGTVTAAWSQYADEPLPAQYAIRTAAGWSAPAEIAAGGAASELLGMPTDEGGRALAILWDRTGASSRGVWALLVTGGWTVPQYMTTDPAWRPITVAGRDGMVLAMGADNTVIRYGTAPDAPTAVAGTGANRAIAVRWTAPQRPGAPISGYVASAQPGGARCATTGATTCTIHGLAPGTAYRISVTAANAFGTGPASLSSDPVTTTAGARVGRVRGAAVGANGVVRVPVTAPGPGRVTLTGTSPSRARAGRAARPIWRCTARTTFTAAGTRTLRCPLRPGALRVLRRGAMHLMLRAVYVPADDGAGIVTTSSAVIPRRR